MCGMVERCGRVGVASNRLHITTRVNEVDQGLYIMSARGSTLNTNETFHSPNFERLEVNM